MPTYAPTASTATAMSTAITVARPRPPLPRGAAGDVAGDALWGDSVGAAMTSVGPATVWGTSAEEWSNWLASAAAKSAHVGLVRALATELAPEGIRVNGVAPGWIDTALFRHATSTDPARKAKIMGRIPMGRVGTAADIGWAMTYLASDAAAYVTGHVLVVDGGALHGF